MCKSSPDVQLSFIKQFYVRLLGVFNLLPDSRVQNVDGLHVGAEGPEASVDCRQAKQGHGRDCFGLKLM
jgi:hypothetical protein